MNKEINKYYYEVFKKAHDDYQRYYRRDPSNCIAYGDYDQAVIENNLKLEKYQRTKDYKKICEDLIASFNKQGECYSGYNQSDSRDYYDAAIELSRRIRNTKLPNGECIDDPDGSKRRASIEAAKNEVDEPFCEQIVTYISLKSDIEDFGTEFMEKYLTENYPSMEWKPLFDAIVDGNVTEEIKKISVFRK
jgi:hypothetical protein